MLGWVYYVQALCLLSSTSFLSKGLRGYCLQKGRLNSIWGNDTRHFKDHLKRFQVLATTVQTGWEMSPLIFYLLLLRWVSWYQCIKWRDSRGIKVKEITDKVEMVIWPKNSRNKLLIRIFLSSGILAIGQLIMLFLKLHSLYSVITTYFMSVAGKMT